jgi:hypothetical protein
MKRTKRVALYLRVSTSEKTTRNQRRELEAVAKRHGWKVAATFEDAGISGAKGREARPGFDAEDYGSLAHMMRPSRKAASSANANATTPNASMIASMLYLSTAHPASVFHCTSP